MNTENEQSDGILISTEDFFNFTSKEDLVEHTTWMVAGGMLYLIDKEMNKQKISRKEMAKRLNTSVSYLTSLFRMHYVAPMEFYVKMGIELGVGFQIKAEKLDKTKWKF